MAQINMPQAGPSPLDRIASALSIVNGIQGIRNNSQAQDIAKETSEQKKAEADREKQGIFTQKEIITNKLRPAKYDKDSKPEDGAIEISVQQGDGQIVKSLYKREHEFNPLAEVIKNQTIEKNRKDLAETKPAQAQAAGFAKRIEQSEAVFKSLQEKGFDPTSVKSRVQSMGIYPELAKSGEIKQQQQAERNFVNSVLRRESGAAISPSEFENAEKQYFPRAGDPPEVLAQKAENRRIVKESIAVEAGSVMNKIGGPAKSATPPIGLKVINGVKYKKVQGGWEAVD